MIFFDTNVILDILDRSRDNHDKALMLLSAAQKGAIKVVATTQSIVDAAYVRTQTDKASLSDFRRVMAALCDIIAVCPVTSMAIEDANASARPDFEDAVQLSCAICEECEAIVTSDRKFKSFTTIPTYSVDEFYRVVFGE